MDPREFLPIAERYMVSNSQAERRTSVGRSYYALFHVLLGALSARGVIFRQVPEDHYTLISYLARSGNKTAASVSSVLRDLRQERNRADYSLSDPFDLRISEFVYKKAIKALESFDSIPMAELATIVNKIQAMP
jgi:hypothetical protein